MRRLPGSFNRYQCEFSTLQTSEHFQILFSQSPFCHIPLLGTVIFYHNYIHYIPYHIVQRDKHRYSCIHLELCWSLSETFKQFHDRDIDLDLHRIMSGFHGAFATGVACQQETLTLPYTWFLPPVLGLACAPVVETRFLELAMSLLDFSTRIPLQLVLSRCCLVIFIDDSNSKLKFKLNGR